MKIGKYLIVYLARDPESGDLYQNVFISPAGMDVGQVGEFAKDAAEEWIECYLGATLEKITIKQVEDAQL